MTMQSLEPVPIISLSRLESQNREEIQLLFRACTSSGFFLLELNGNEATEIDKSVLAQADQIFELASEFFKLDQEEKLGYEMDRWGDMHIGGYKAAGKHTGSFSGKRDGFENFLLPLNKLLGFRAGVVPGPLPAILEVNTASFEKFHRACHGICNSILTSLSLALSRENRDPLQGYHRYDQPSTTSLAMLKYLPTSALTPDQVGHMAHTDVGSLTLLFTSSPGLEVLSRTTSTWIPLTPPSGTVAVNVGDTLRYLSSGVLESCLHRVVPQVSQETGLSTTRYSLAFFHRPELDAEFMDAQGNLWTGEQWHKTKYRIFRASNHEQMQNSLLTGRVGFLGEANTDIDNS